jgi:hypothetical protein
MIVVLVWLLIRFLQQRMSKQLPSYRLCEGYVEAMSVFRLF